ncbi:unnamed protein product [Timema podura]|uniref:Uncharacterized protein n=1 Tax=Timema podura TaxID=61482 RepID=A0ABN7NP27_TIMPD|nr:unnamed protein product [Timema podura]
MLASRTPVLALAAESGVVQVVDGVVEEDSAMLLISIHFWYGMFLQSRGRYGEARDHFEEAYTMSAHTKSILSSQLMVILYHLSEVTFAAGDMDSSLKHLLSAVVLGRDSKHPDLPLYYAKIGVVYLHKGVYDQAKAW